ncbi:MAG: beta-N-acetylhexosaminidase, partial [Bacteroidota bacterium]
MALNLADYSMIPMPVKAEASGSSYAITGATHIYVDQADEGAMLAAQGLQDFLKVPTGFELAIKDVTSHKGQDGIALTLDGEAFSSTEAYEMAISEEGIMVKAGGPAGLFYAVQSLRQLLPAHAERRNQQQGPWLIPSGMIADAPRFAYRGAMLDVSRHFFGVNDVKRYIDYLAMYKLNYLHLHLSDDQGWRIEIKSRPKLTEIGGSTEVGGGESGFYTQEQYQDIVAYAAARFITIVPEIDIPGHTNAALASYAELNCDGKAPKLYTGTEVGFSTLCTDKEET